MKRSLLILLVVCTAFIGAVVGSIVTLRFYDAGPSYTSIEERQNLRFTNYAPDSSNRIQPAINFEAAAREVTPAV
ncbi:MAG TPA: hypothetical protein PL167_09925, partial [Cyclobacteriaceae bacterium]|nr:hypothetical protein [Cyclobacteriaceae bacterium]